MWRAVVGAGVAVALVLQRHRVPVPLTPLWSDWNKETNMKTLKTKAPTVTQSWPVRGFTNELQLSTSLFIWTWFSVMSICLLNTWVLFQIPCLENHRVLSRRQWLMRRWTFSYLHKVWVLIHIFILRHCLITTACVCLHNRDKLLESCVCTGPGKVYHCSRRALPPRSPGH